MSVRASIENDEVRFKRYLVREVFWEMKQQNRLPAAFAGIPQGSVEVLTFQGYDVSATSGVLESFAMILSRHHFAGH